MCFWLLLSASVAIFHVVSIAARATMEQRVVGATQVTGAGALIGAGQHEMWHANDWNDPESGPEGDPHRCVATHSWPPLRRHSNKWADIHYFPYFTAALMRSLTGHSNQWPCFASKPAHSDRSCSFYAAKLWTHARCSQRFVSGRFERSQRWTNNCVQKDWIETIFHTADRNSVTADA